MRETRITHLPNDETILESREDSPTLDLLTKRPVDDPVVFPVIETYITGHANGFLGDPQPTPLNRVWRKMAWGCWHELWSATNQELAGMGLAIIGNLCRAVAAKALSTRADAKLILKLGKAGEEIPLPWPGMPDDRPVPLDLTELPFQFEMFLHDETKQFQKRVHRLQLMQRIEDVWVPHLTGLLKVRV